MITHPHGNNNNNNNNTINLKTTFELRLSTINNFNSLVFTKNWVDLAQDRDRSLVNTVMNLRVP
jgi:hypothetical protein